jgi:threonine aldolase
MYSFACDYLEGCHEEVLKALAESNMVQAPGYGADCFTEKAVSEIRQACKAENASVYMINGGTQTNQLVISTMLQPYEGVLAADTGHVNVHEAGAIEFSGHKVLCLPAHNGKVLASDVEEYVRRFLSDGNHEHMVFPGMVYISHPTEYGTLYSAAELRSLSEVCHRNHLIFYLDGARLGYGLMARDTDVTLPLIASLCDVFYIGGTKVGALNGEALVFPRGNEPKHFVTQIKQHGALSAKGRLVGVQFAALFDHDLYFRISRHAIEMAEKIRTIFQNAGCRFYIDSPTNQQFVILKNETLDKLKNYVEYGFWEKYDETHTVVRFASSWATTEEGIRELQRAVDLCVTKGDSEQ